jgi:hypothetical protein
VCVCARARVCLCISYTATSTVDTYVCVCVCGKGFEETLDLVDKALLETEGPPPRPLSFSFSFKKKRVYTHLEALKVGVKNDVLHSKLCLCQRLHAHSKTSSIEFVFFKRHRILGIECVLMGLFCDRAVVT